ncbi:MAG: DUF1971 domain-containing protein [Alphaproteobacteria bacterium]
MKTLPQHVRKYKATPVFDENTLPQGLLKDHATKENVWGVIRIQTGKLEYNIQNGTSQVLTADTPGIIEPTVKHHIKPLGSVSFCVEFYK